MTESDLPQGSQVELDVKQIAKPLDRQPPEQLYHDTDQNGLLGILESGELRATKVQHMNDTQEFALAVGSAEDRLKERINISHDEGDRRLLQNIIDGLSSIAHVNICSVSFCENPDLLSQWRGYSRTSGVAIGFRSVDLKRVAWRDGGRLGTCIYQEEDQIKIIEGVIDDLLQKPKALEAHDSADYNQLKGYFDRTLITYGAFLKHSSFSEEQEWRLVTSITRYDDEKFCFRAGKSLLIPYYKIPLRQESWKDEIGAVTIGPCPHPEISQIAVDGLLLKHGISDGTNLLATPSTIPYRNW